MATREELNARIAAMYSAINSFQANVDMTPSEGSVYKGKITEIKDILAIVLFGSLRKFELSEKPPWFAPRLSIWCRTVQFQVSPADQKPVRTRSEQRPRDFQEQNRKPAARRVLLIYVDPARG